MSSFKSAPVAMLDDKYESGIKVIMESEEDVSIFRDHWFPRYQNKLRFESAEDGSIGGGGCHAVRQKVEDARSQRLNAFGIVDRDTLLSDGKTGIFWEIDDASFEAAQPYDFIHVLRRWELENYLLRPEAFAAEVRRRDLRSQPLINSQTLLNQHEEDLIGLTALTTFMMSQNEKSPKPGFGLDSSGQQLKEKIGTHLDNKLPGKSYSDLETDIGKISSFHENHQEPDKRWERLTRILDGKKTLSRICDRLSKEHGLDSIKPWEEMRGCLANQIASLGLDNELKEAMERFVRLG